ncbi:hypothetical protein ACIBCM_31915 [Streptomyces sp. NPDC051018]|uniref:hypothetical protein n=1 Tax=Streptomyces sp. NPDC051018 TaxID=3365639 RepID=UPI0037A6DB38
MKRPLRTALADALYLRELRELRDLRHHRQQHGRSGCGMEPCGLALQRAEAREEDGRRADHPGTDYRTPDRCETDGDRRGRDFHTDGRRRTGQGSGEQEEDTLFLFLKSMHQFLTAPQDAATAGHTDSAEHAESVGRADRKADDGNQP